MIIDKPRAETLPALKDLWQEAFGDSREFIDTFFRTGFSPDRCRCLWKADRPAAALYWFDCDWGKRKLAYLYAVATDKTFRNQGLCRQLMEDTHRHLKSLGYSGAVLVPGEPELFSFYEKLGYAPFGSGNTVTILPAGRPVPLTTVAETAYQTYRSRILPENSVAHTAEVYRFLSAVCQFYTAEGALFCLSLEGDTAHFQEFLGDPSRLPGILVSLGAKKGIVSIPGSGTPLAMYRSFTDDSKLPTYFGIPLN